MLASKELHQAVGRDTPYPPSILMVGGSGFPVLKLKRWLEHNGYRVCQADICSDSLATAPQPYFDLVVLNLESTAGDESEVGQKLTTHPELAHLPVVVLTPPGCPLKAIPGLKMVKSKSRGGVKTWSMSCSLRIAHRGKKFYRSDAKRIFDHIAGFGKGSSSQTIHRARLLLEQS